MPLRRRPLFAIALIGETASLIAGTAQSPAATAVAFTNGRWFNGAVFEQRATVYSVDGRLSFAAPGRIGETVDLTGAWIVPSFAEPTITTSPTAEVTKQIGSRCGGFLVTACSM